MMRRAALPSVVLLVAGCALTDPDSAINERAVTSPTAVFGGRTYTAVAVGVVHGCATETGGLARCRGAATRRRTPGTWATVW
jgi:hypothetical protein